jgi:enoyl-CoA hydratase
MENVRMNDTTRETPIVAERSDAVLRIVLNRPDRLNAVSLQLYQDLHDAIRQAERDETIRAVLLTGAGRAFCAGADLKAHADSSMSPAQRRTYGSTAQRVNFAIQSCDKPVVAAVNGAAVGAGLELALSCDFIIVAEDAKLRLPEIALATFVGGGVFHTLPERVGLARAREILLLGEFLTGADALRIGLADRAVPAADVLPAAEALAQRLAANAPVSMAFARRLFRQAPRMRRRELMAAEARALAKCMATEDWREGVLAFREKREPRYRGR